MRELFANFDDYFVVIKNKKIWKKARMLKNQKVGDRKLVTVYLYTPFGTVIALY